MRCIIATPKQDNSISTAEIIKSELKGLPEFKDWAFEVAHDEEELYNLKTKPNVIVFTLDIASNIEHLLKQLPLVQPYSRLVVLVGPVSAKTKAFTKMAKSFGITNIVTGKIPETPGDRPYTLPVALLNNKETLLEKEYISSEVESTRAIESVLNHDNTQDASIETGSETKKYDSSHIPKGRRFKIKKAPVKVKTNNVNQEKQSHNKGNTAPEQEDAQTFQYNVENDDINYQQQHVNNRQQKHNITQKSQSRLQFAPVFNEHQPNSMWNRQSGTLIATVANKGGVGKTTTAVTLAHALAGVGLEVAIIDIDFGSPNVTDMFSLKSIDHGIETLAGRGRGVQYLLDQVIVKAPKHPNINILPGPISKTIPEESLFPKGQLAEVVRTLLDRFPLVIADTPANFRISPWVPEVLQMCDLALAVVDQSEFSESDTARFAPELMRQGVHPQNIRIILNKFSPKAHNARIVKDAFLAGFKKNVPKKQLPDIIATIPADWDAHLLKGYKGDVVGLDDPYSQWHSVAEEIANIAGYNYQKNGGQNKKQNFFKKLFKRG